MISYNAYFFDFDGVLADSVEVKTRAFAKLFEKFGKDIQAKVVAHHRNNGGMSRYDKFRYYYKEFLKRPLPEEEFRNLCERFSRLVVDEVVAAPEIKGVRVFLEKCHMASPCFVVSATPEEEIREIVKRRDLHEYFLNVVGAPASKKENLQKLLEIYNLVPEQCVFFGDAESDYRAATICRVNFIAILPNENAPLLQIEPQIKWHKDFSTLSE